MTDDQTIRNGERFREQFEQLPLGAARPLTQAELAARDAKRAAEDAARADVRAHYAGEGRDPRWLHDWLKGPP